jgi:hypothetical protein
MQWLIILIALVFRGLFRDVACQVTAGVVVC